MCLLSGCQTDRENQASKIEKLSSAQANSVMSIRSILPDTSIVCRKSGPHLSRLQVTYEVICEYIAV